MASTNDNVAALLREYAELLAITGGDPFRARNYEKAAKAVAGYPADIAAMDDAALTTIPGVGKSIAAKIAEYRRTGAIAAVEALRGKIPAGVRDLTRVPGLGPKRAVVLSAELGIASVDDLREAVEAGRLRDLGQRADVFRVTGDGLGGLLVVPRPERVTAGDGQQFRVLPQ